jgi:hypothetical protein
MRAVAEAHRERDALVLVANLRDLAAAASAWAAQVERVLGVETFDVPAPEPRRQRERPKVASTGRRPTTTPPLPGERDSIRGQVIA